MKGRKNFVIRSPTALQCGSSIQETRSFLAGQREGRAPALVVSKRLLATQGQQRDRAGPQHRSLVGLLEGTTGEEEPEKRLDFTPGK